MARNPALAVTEVEEVVIGSAAPAAGRASDWGAITGGALAAIGVSIILFTAGSGFGLSTVEPWSFANRAPETFAIGAAVWLVVMQWLSAGVGGYLAGRLRAKWIGPRTDEVLFRDTAHGFLAWALATVIVATLLTLGALGAGAVAVTGEAAQPPRPPPHSPRRRATPPPTSRSSRQSRCWSAPSSARSPAALAAITATRPSLAQRSGAVPSAAASG
jgi:hypothetical protein